MMNLELASNCQDCGAAIGEQHRGGCEVERCPACGGQYLSCGCEDAEQEHKLPWTGERPGAKGTAPAMKIKTHDGNWYVRECGGVNYVTWVAKNDKEYAARFPVDTGQQWLQLLADITGMELEGEFSDSP